MIAVQQEKGLIFKTIPRSLLGLKIIPFPVWASTLIFPSVSGFTVPSQTGLFQEEVAQNQHGSWYRPYAFFPAVFVIFITENMP